MEGAGGSPTGSQAGQLDGAQLALRMVQAAESAATAAQAVSTALALASQSSSSSSGGLFSGDSSQLYKLLSKPQNFDPSSREQEIAMWREWSWSFEQYLASLDSHYPEELKVIRGNLGTEIDQSVQDDKERQRGTFLYGLLSGVLRQRPLMLLKQVPNSNGFEAYRQLCAANEPQNKNRSMSLLSTIMSWQQFSNKSSLLSQIMRLDGAFLEYERLGSKLNDELKAAILLRSVTGQLRTWLQLQVSETTTYSNVRERILAYERSTSKRTEQMVLGSDLSLNSSHDTSGPMEVDRVFDAKGKHKGEKGKGKDKGKNKGKFDSGKGKGSGFKGSSTWDSNGFNQGKGSWNQNSQNQNADGKSGKSSPKGKGKSGKNKGSCFKCGKFGHMAKECRVRFVEEVDDSCCDNAASNATSNATNAATTNNGSSSGNVNRVSLHEHSTSSSSRPQYFFDLSVCSDFSWLNVNAVSEVVDVSKYDDCHNHFNLLDPESSSDVSGGLIDDGELQCGLQTVGDECSQDVLHCVDECKYSSTSNIEFMSCSSPTCRCEYSLYTLCKLDDYDHFNNIVSLSNGFSLYERVLLPGGAWNLIRRFDDSPCFKLNCCNDAFENFALDVRAVRSCCDIILDSGSDATVIPIGMVSAGVPSANQSSYLRDAQGAKIDTEGVRDISIVLTAVDGNEIVLQDKAHASSRVDMPLISYGKLLRHGWGIVPEDGRSFLVHSSGAKVELNFRQNPLLVSGVVRMIAESVRVIDVDVPKAWHDLKNGWYKTKDGFPLCSSHARHFVDVLKITPLMSGRIEQLLDTVMDQDGRSLSFVKVCFNLMSVRHHLMQVTRS